MKVEAEVEAEAEVTKCRRHFQMNSPRQLQRRQALRKWLNQVDYMYFRYLKYVDAGSSEWGN